MCFVSLLRATISEMIDYSPRDFLNRALVLPGLDESLFRVHDIDENQFPMNRCYCWLKSLLEISKRTAINHHIFSLNRLKSWSAQLFQSVIIALYVTSSRLSNSCSPITILPSVCVDRIGMSRAISEREAWSRHSSTCTHNGKGNDTDIESEEVLIYLPIVL